MVKLNDVRKRLAQPRCDNDLVLDMYAQLKRSGDFAGFVALLHDDDALVARNAAWVLTKCTKRELRQLLPMLNEFIDIALSTPSETLRRLTLNIIERLPLAKESIRTDFLDFCLDQMVRLSTPAGIQALCMKIAYRLCMHYPELHEEIMRTVGSLDLSLYQPALKCTVKNVMQGKLR